MLCLSVSGAMSVLHSVFLNGSESRCGCCEVCLCKWSYFMSSAWTYSAAASKVANREYRLQREKRTKIISCHRIALISGEKATDVSNFRPQMCEISLSVLKHGQTFFDLDDQIDEQQQKIIGSTNCSSSMKEADLLQNDSGRSERRIVYALTEGLGYGAK